MAKKKKLNSKNPKYYPDVKEQKVVREILIANVKGVTIKGVWYE